MGNQATTNGSNILHDDFEDDLVISADVFSDADSPPVVLQETKPLKTKTKPNKSAVMAENKIVPQEVTPLENKPVDIKNTQEKSGDKSATTPKPNTAETRATDDGSGGDFSEKAFFRLNDIHSRISDISRLNGEFKKFIENFTLFTKEEAETREVLQAIFEQMTSISTEMASINKQFISLNKHLPGHIKEIKEQLGAGDSRPTITRRLFALIRSTEFKIYCMLGFLLVLLTYSAYKVNLLEQRLDQFINRSPKQEQPISPAKVTITDQESTLDKKAQPKKLKPP